MPRRPRVVPGLFTAVALAASWALAGCSGNSGGRLETGYRYRAINASQAERRAFYSDPYSVEARLAETGGGDTIGPVGGGRQRPGGR